MYLIEIGACTHARPGGLGILGALENLHIKYEVSSLNGLAVTEV